MPNIDALSALHTSRTQHVWRNVKVEDFRNTYQSRCDDTLIGISSCLDPETCAGWTVNNGFRLKQDLNTLVDARPREIGGHSALEVRKESDPPPNPYVTPETRRAFNQVRREAIENLRLEPHQRTLLAQRLADPAFTESLQPAEREEMVHLCTHGAFEESFALQVEQAMQSFEALLTLLTSEPADLRCSLVNPMDAEMSRPHLKTIGDMVSLKMEQETYLFQTAKSMLYKVLASRSRETLTQIQGLLTRLPKDIDPAVNRATQAFTDATGEMLTKHACTDLGNPLADPPPLSQVQAPPSSSSHPYLLRLREAIVTRINAWVDAILSALRPHSQSPVSVLDGLKNNLIPEYSPYASDTRAFQAAVKEPGLITNRAGEMGIRAWIGKFNLPQWTVVPPFLTRFAFRSTIDRLRSDLKPTAHGYKGKVTASFDARLDYNFVKDANGQLINETGTGPNEDTRVVLNDEAFIHPEFTPGSQKNYAEKTVLKFASDLVTKLDLRKNPEVPAQFDADGKLYDDQMLALIMQANQKVLGPVEDLLRYIVGERTDVEYPHAFRGQPCTEKREFLYRKNPDDSVDLTFSVMRSGYTKVGKPGQPSVKVENVCLGVWAKVNISKERGIVLFETETTGHLMRPEGKRIEFNPAESGALFKRDFPDKAALPEQVIADYERTGQFSPDQAEALLSAIQMAKEDGAKTVSRRAQTGQPQAIGEFRKGGANEAMQKSIQSHFLDCHLLPAGTPGVSQNGLSGAARYSGDAVLNLLDESGFSREDLVGFDAANVEGYFIARFRGGREIMLSNRMPVAGELRGKELRQLMLNTQWKSLRDLFANALEALEQRFIAQSLVQPVGDALSKINVTFSTKEKKEAALVLYFDALRNSFPVLEQRFYLKKALESFYKLNQEEWPPYAEVLENATRYIPGLPCDVAALSASLNRRTITRATAQVQ